MKIAWAADSSSDSDNVTFVPSSAGSKSYSPQGRTGPAVPTNPTRRPGSYAVTSMSAASGRPPGPTTCRVWVAPTAGSPCRAMDTTPEPPGSFRVREEREHGADGAIEETTEPEAPTCVATSSS